MRTLVISRQSLGHAIARALTIVFAVSAIRALAVIGGYAYRVFSETRSLGVLSVEEFLPEVLEVLGSGLFATWLWSRSNTFLPEEEGDEEEREEISISPGLVTQGILLALGLYLFIPALGHILETFARNPATFKAFGQFNNFLDVGFALILFVSSAVAARRLNRTVAAATSANTDPHPLQPELATVQIREDFAPPAR